MIAQIRTAKVIVSELRGEVFLFYLVVTRINFGLDNLDSVVIKHR